MLAETNSSQLLRSEKVTLLSQIYTTVNSFADLGIQEFGCEIELCFVRLFELAERWFWVENLGVKGLPRPSQDSITRYDASVIQDALSAIDWRKCCSNFDLTRCNSEWNAPGVSPTTAIEVLLQLIQEGKCCWRDSTTLRCSLLRSQLQAACIPIVSTLFRVATSSVGNYNSPSGSLLRETISTIISRAAPSTSFTDIIVEELRLKVPSSTVKMDQSSIHSAAKSWTEFPYEEARSALDCSLWLCKKLIRRENFGPPLATLIVTTFSDCHLISTVISNQKTKTNFSANLETFKSNSHVRVRHRGAAAAPMKLHHLSHHHECVFYDMEGNDSSILIHKKRYKDGREIDKAMLRDEVDRRKREALQALGRMQVTGTQPKLSKKEKLTCFLENLLDYLLKLLHLINLHCPYEAKRASTFRSILTVACQQRPKCIGATLCAMVAASLRSDGMSLLMQQLWASFLCNVTTTFDHLRRYSDFVVDCCHFDDTKNCWMALDTLTSFAFRIAMRLQDGSCSHVLQTLFIALGRAIFHVLVHRRSVLSRDDRFPFLLTKLSFHIGENIRLLLREMTAEEREFATEFSCATGIMSFIEVNTIDEDFLKSEKSLKNTDRWPFPCKHCIQSSDQFALQLASNFMSVEKDEWHSRQYSQMQGKEVVTRVHKNGGGNCALNVITEDIILNIFSYFGYRRVTKLGEVCKEWYTVGQNPILWRQMYARRWPNAINDPFAFPAKSSEYLKCWKGKFMKKWQVERGLRSKYSSDGWKHKTCDYIGCNSVLRSLQQSIKHSEKHKNDSAKRKISHERSEAIKSTKIARKRAKQSQV